MGNFISEHLCSTLLTGKSIRTAFHVVLILLLICTHNFDRLQMLVLNSYDSRIYQLHKMKWYRQKLAIKKVEQSFVPKIFSQKSLLTLTRSSGKERVLCNKKHGKNIQQNIPRWQNIFQFSFGQPSPLNRLIHQLYKI